MPLVDIQVIKGVFTDDKKRAKLGTVTESKVSVEGEKMRGVTWVRGQEVESGQWAIGGNPITAEAVREMAKS